MQSSLDVHLIEFLSLLFRKYNAQMLDIFHRAPAYGVVLVALECHLSSLHVMCLHRRYTALHNTLQASRLLGLSVL